MKAALSIAINAKTGHSDSRLSYPKVSYNSQWSEKWQRLFN
jgi:hypothetical protein